MEYIFGGTFVCDGLHEAKTVTFDSRVQTRCVSLAGDVFDPSGTLSGGTCDTYSIVACIDKHVYIHVQYRLTRVAD